MFVCLFVFIFVELAFGKLYLGLQVIYYHFLVTLPDDALAKEIWNEMKKGSFPSLFAHIESILEEWNIDLNSVQYFTKNAWKREMKTRVKCHNFLQLINWCKSYKKIDYRKY